MAKKFQYSIPAMTRRLLRIAAPVKKTLLISTFASILGNLSQMGLMGSGALLLLSCTDWGSSYASASPWTYGIFTAASGVLIVVCRYLEGVVSHVGAYDLLARMRVELFRSIRRLAPAYLVEREKGDLMNIAVSDIETIEFFFAHTIGPMFTVILLPCVTLGLALSIQPLFAAVLLPIYVIISVVFPCIAVRLGRPIGARYRERLGRLKSLVLESIYGLKDIQIFSFGSRRLEMVREQNRAVSRAAHGLVLHQQTVLAAPAFFVYLARIAIIAAASWLAAGGFVKPAETVVLSFVAMASFSSTQSLTTVVSSLLETYAAAERLFLIQDTPPEIQECRQPKACGPIRSIRFEHISFSYPGSGKEVLRDFDLDVGEREKIGIVGESGIGKSTVLRLLLRFWNPCRGRILVNGIPIQELSLEELYSRIAVLEQDTFLFNCSIADNISIGKPEASREEIIRAAKRAGLHDFIAGLPDGYDTQMGQMGARLSGGERQRVGIARTMLTDPDVLVMDEPTSSLDVLHEKELLKTLQEGFQDKMIFLVSHRPSTLTGCTRIVRLEAADKIQ